MCPPIVLKVVLTLWNWCRLSGKGVPPQRKIQGHVCWSGKAVDVPFVREPRVPNTLEGMSLHSSAKKPAFFVKCHGLAELLGDRASQARAHSTILFYLCFTFFS